jgi:hypothetical protein
VKSVEGTTIMSTASQDGGLRVSDADRDQAISELSEHFQAGRLSTEEFEDRSGQALQARTRADLAALFTDLPRAKPGGPVPATSSSPVGTPAASAPARPSLVLALPIVVLAIVALAGAVSGHFVTVGVLPVIVVLIVLRRLTGGQSPRRDRHARDGQY